MHSYVPFARNTKRNSGYKRFHTKGRTMTKKEQPDFTLYIHDLEKKVRTAHQLKQQNLYCTLKILLDDAIKWESEYQKGRIGYADANTEIRCLHIFAKQEWRQGENGCSPEAIKTILTA